MSRRPFAKITSKLFLDSRFRRISADAQITYVWLRATHMTSAGGAFMSPELAATECGRPVELMREVFGELERAGLIELDLEENLVRAPEEVDVQPMTSPDQVKGSLNMLREVPASRLRNRAVAQVIPKAIRARRKYRTNEMKALEGGKVKETNTARESMSAVDRALRELIEELDLVLFLRSEAGLSEEDLVYLAEITCLRGIAWDGDRALDRALDYPPERQETKTETKTQTEIGRAGGGEGDTLLAKWRTSPDLAPPVPGRHVR